MSYIQNSMGPNEHVIAHGKWPVIYWVGAWAALIVLGVILVGVYIFVRAVITMSTTEFAVTDSRVILKEGWLNVRTQELSVGSIEGVQLVQSIWGKLFGFGCVMVTGTGDAHLVFPPMAHPIAFRRAIEAGREQDQQHVTAPPRVEIDREDRVPG